MGQRRRKETFFVQLAEVGFVQFSDSEEFFQLNQLIDQLKDDPTNVIHGKGTDTHERGREASEGANCEWDNIVGSTVIQKDDAQLFHQQVMTVLKHAEGAFWPTQLVCPVDPVSFMVSIGYAPEGVSDDLHRERLKSAAHFALLCLPCYPIPQCDVKPELKDILAGKLLRYRELLLPGSYEWDSTVGSPIVQTNKNNICPDPPLQMNNICPLLKDYEKFGTDAHPVHQHVAVSKHAEKADGAFSPTQLVYILSFMVVKRIADSIGYALEGERLGLAARCVLLWLLPRTCDWFSKMGDPIPQIDGTCAISASVMCLFALLKIAYEKIYGMDSFRFKVKDGAAEEIKATCMSKGVWGSGGFVDKILEQVIPSLEGLLTVDDNIVHLPLIITGFEFETRYSMGPEDVVLMLTQGPVVGGLSYDDASYCNMQAGDVYRGAKQGEAVTPHAVVCIGYKYSDDGKELHIKILDNHTDDGPVRWVLYDVFTEFTPITVSAFKPSAAGVCSINP